MKKPVGIISLIFMFNLVITAQEKQVYKNEYLVRVGEVAPDFTVNEAGGKSYRLKDLKGKTIMLQFTASWCSVCRQEMPFIETEIWKPGKDKGLVVIGIDRDEPVEKVIKFKKDIGITYPLALDPGADIFGLFATERGRCDQECDYRPHR